MAAMLADDAFRAAFTRRTFLKGAGAAGLLAAIPVGLGGCSGPQIDTLARILIVGGVTAGITMAARLRRACPKATITLVEPSERHYYQPGFTFIGAGVWEPDDVWMNERDLVPAGVAWLKDAVVAIDPDRNVASLRDGGKIVYDFLVLVPGIQLNWSQVEGITRETLGLGNTHSIYDFEGSVRTWKALQEFARTGGRGVFADTWTKHKCGGAPKKICLLGEHLSRKLGTRHRLSFSYFTASKQLYDVPHYTPRLEEIYRERDVPVRLNAKLTGVDVDAKKAYFEDRATGETYTETYDFLHFVPPQSAPDFVRESGLGWTEGKLADGGWVMVDPKTLVHKKYANVVSLGDGRRRQETGARGRREPLRDHFRERAHGRLQRLRGVSDHHGLRPRDHVRVRLREETRTFVPLLVDGHAERTQNRLVGQAVPPEAVLLPAHAQGLGLRPRLTARGSGP